ncbi:MAG: putative acyl-CoA dehydrogenase [Frankiales bacterium]|nr:putative acyl-CoA dehydrogenase [Frankiales bacterium]
MTNFVATPEQRELRDSVRRFLANKSDSAAVRARMDTAEGSDPAVWAQLAGQLGVHALAIDEEYGGLGFGFAELCVVLGELGRAVTVTPFLASVAVAASALANSGDTEAMKTYLPGIAAGETVATLALSDTGADPDLAHVALAASQTDSGWQLTGVKAIVLDGAAADLILVAARTPAGLSLFAVDGNARGLTRTQLSVLDLTRKQARLDFVGTPARLVGTDGGAADGLSRTLDLAAVALAAEQTGGAEKCLEMAVDYAKTRYQFGRPIGSYQAITHKCADMLAQVEMAKSAYMYAASVADQGVIAADELKIAASVAKAFCSDAYLFCAGENIQIHGGIGFTWEHDAHLYFKRAKSSELMFGDPQYHRNRLAGLLAL